MNSFEYQDLKRRASELRNELFIDKDDLHEDIRRQPQLFADASELYAEIVSVRDKAKEDLELLLGEISLDLREEYNNLGEKYTEKSIAQEASTSKGYQKARKEWYEIVHLYNLLGGLKEAFAKRSSALSDLQRLYVANYYSDPTVSVSESQADEFKAEEGRRKLTDARRKRINKRRITY